MYLEMDQPIPLDRCQLPPDWNWSKVKTINGLRCERLRNEPDKIKSVIGHLPKTAKKPSAVRSYIIEWDETDKNGKHLRNIEPADGRFTHTGGAYFIRPYWAKLGIVYDHKSLHYQDLDEFQYLTEDEAECLEQIEAVTKPFIY